VDFKSVGKCVKKDRATLYFIVYLLHITCSYYKLHATNPKPNPNSNPNRLVSTF